MNDTLDEIFRAYSMWKKWHNPASRRWYRLALALYRAGG